MHGETAGERYVDRDYDYDRYDDDGEEREESP